MDREQVAKKREYIKDSLRQSREGSKFGTHDTVYASSVIHTQLRSLSIPVGTKGEINKVFKWIAGYDVEFKIHGISIIVSCMEDQLKKSR